LAATISGSGSTGEGVNTFARPRHPRTYRVTRFALIATHIKEALRLRYPKADFTEYFAFLEACPVAEYGEGHHIIPQSVPRVYQGKVYELYKSDPAGIIKLTIADHDKAHLLLGKAEPWLLRTARRARGF